MGSSPSIMFPPRLTRDEFRDLFTENIYCDYIYEKLMNKTDHQGTIERKVFVEYAMSVKDIYLLHDWDQKRDNHHRVLKVLHYFENHGILCHHNEQREDYPTSHHHSHDHKDLNQEDEYCDHLDNSRVYIIAITKKCIDRIRGHGHHGMRDLLAQEFQYILKRKGAKWMIPVIMDVNAKNTMRWRGPIKQTFAPNQSNDRNQAGNVTQVDDADYPFVCLLDDGEGFENGIQELMKRVMDLIHQSCKDIIHSRVFSRLKCLEGDDPQVSSQESTSSVVTYVKANPFATYRHTYTRHTLTVISLALYGTSYLLSGSGDRKVHLWDRNVMEVVHSFSGPGGVHSLLVYGDHLFVAYTNKIINIWNLLDRSLVLTYKTRSIEAMIVVPSDDPAICHLYTGHSKSFRRCDVFLTSSPPAIKETHSLVGREDTVYCAALFQNHILFTGSVGNTIRVWDLRYFGTDLTIVSLSSHTGRVNCLLVSGSRLFSGSDDCTVRIWDIIALTPVSILEGHEGPVTSLVTASSLLYSASKDHKIFIWNLLTNERSHTLRGHTEGVYCLAMDQTKLYSGGADFTIKVWTESADNELIALKKNFSFQHDLLALTVNDPEDTTNIEECVDLLSDEADANDGLEIENA